MVKSINPNTGVKGLDIVLSNLNKQIKLIEGRTQAGCVMVTSILRNDMDNVEPKIPVDTGNLRSSWFSSPVKQGEMIGVIFGFEANYALYVHEMLDSLGTKINWTREGSGAKFMEASMKRNVELILKTLRDYTEIK